MSETVSDTWALRFGRVRWVSLVTERRGPPRSSRRSRRRRGPSTGSRLRTATGRGRHLGRASLDGTPRSALVSARLAVSQLVTGTSEKNMPNIVPARATWTPSPSAASPASSRAPARSRPSQTPGSADRAQRLDPGRHRERVPGERPRLVDGACRGDQLHDLAASAVRADGKPAADHLPERRQVGRHAVERLCAARMNPEPGHHLVEDEERAVRSGQCAQPFEEPRLREDEPHVPDDRLEDHGGDVVVSSNSAATAARSLNGAVSVSATAPGVTPGESGSPSVATPEPACTRSRSAWPW